MARPISGPEHPRHPLRRHVGRPWPDPASPSRSLRRQRLIAAAAPVRNNGTASSWGTRQMRMLAAIALIMPFAAAAIAQPAGDFYKGKTLSVVVGHEAGTGYDFFGRTLARHIGRHIPGQPNVVPQNTPGAGGLKTANWL